MIITPIINQDKKAVKDAYLQAITDLTSIQSNTTSTNAKLLANQKLIAGILLKLAKYIKTTIV
jgi:hypothetical protein